VDVQNVPAGVDTVILGTMLRKVDPAMEISAIVDSAQFYPIANSTYQQIKLHSVRFTKCALDWVEGRRDTGDPAVDGFQIYRVDGPVQPARLTVVPNKTLSALFEIGEAAGLGHFQLERMLRHSFNASLENTPLRNKVKAVQILRTTRGNPAVSTRPSPQPIGKAECRVMVEDKTIAEQLLLHTPGLSVGAGNSLRTTIALRLLRDQETIAADHEGRVRELRTTIIEQAQAFEPARIVRVLEVQLEFVLPPELRTKSVGEITAKMISAFGGEQNGLHGLVLPRNGQNRVQDHGRAVSVLLFMDVHPDAAASPADSAADFLHNANHGTALCNDHITKLKIKGTPKITTFGAVNQTPTLAPELNDTELRIRIEKYLFETGPMYIYAQAADGNDVIRTGPDATKLEDMPPSGPPFIEEGVRVCDFRDAFRPGEIRSLERVWSYATAADGRAINVYQPDASAPGPNGALCYVLHHKYNSVYSTERKLVEMEQDPPTPPPDPSGGDASGPSKDASVQDPPPPPPPPPPPAGGNRSGHNSGAKQGRQPASRRRHRPTSATHRAVTTLILMASVLQMLGGVYSLPIDQTPSPASHPPIIFDQGWPRMLATYYPITSDLSDVYSAPTPLNGSWRKSCPYEKARKVDSKLRGTHALMFTPQLLVGNGPFRVNGPMTKVVQMSDDVLQPIGNNEQSQVDDVRDAYDLSTDVAADLDIATVSKTVVDSATSVDVDMTDESRAIVLTPGVDWSAAGKPSLNAVVDLDTAVDLDAAIYLVAAVTIVPVDLDTTPGSDALDSGTAADLNIVLDPAPDVVPDTMVNANTFVDSAATADWGAAVDSAAAAAVHLAITDGSKTVVQLNDLGDLVVGVELDVVVDLTIAVDLVAAVALAVATVDLDANTGISTSIDSDNATDSTKIAV
jgi:hypothetical protein